MNHIREPFTCRLPQSVWISPRTCSGVHGIIAAEKVVVRKQLRRGQVMKFFAALTPCLVGMEACATARHWARELTRLGHEVRLMPAKDVKAYVKRNKNDAADAEAIYVRRFAGQRSDLWGSSRPSSRVG
jgi:transposase